jgi:predicted rRNA methylase
MSNERGLWRKPKSKLKPMRRRIERQSLGEGVFRVEGIAALREYLRFNPKCVTKVFIKSKFEKTYLSELKATKLPIEIVPDRAEDLDQNELPPTPIWAHVKHESFSTVDFEGPFLAKIGKSATVLVLDHISDPRNLGAIVRSAAFFGVRHVIVPERRQVLLTQTAVNTAQGGFALVDLFVVVNVSRTIEMLKEHGFWIIGAALEGSASDSLRNKFERQAIVLGSEDKGISANVLSKCDVKVTIAGAKQRIESLNVSVAAGILLSELVIP